MNSTFFIALFTVVMVACKSEESNHVSGKVLNDTIYATGDEAAISLARKVIEANGGKEKFDAIPILSFDYFGRRYWFWDKTNERFRVESEPRQLRAAGKLDGSQTHLWLRGSEVTDQDTIAKYKDLAYKMWINDTYWLLFPFKLLDKGVHLRYLGNCMADSIYNATCIELTFNNVGVTPENKYVAYIDTLRHEVIYWDYYKNRSDSIPTLSNSWTDYNAYDGVKISGGRGDDTLKEITIRQSLPDRIFTDVSVTFREILGKEK